MRKTFSAGLLLLCLSLYGQKVPFTFHFSDSLLSENPYQNIDTSSIIATGILWDRTVPNIYLPDFTGNIEDTAAYGNLTSFQPAMDLRKAAMDSSVLPSRDSLKSHFRRLTYQHNALPIMLYNMEYEMIKEGALADSLVSLDTASGNFIFGPNFSTSPFEQRSFFAIGIPSGELAVQDTLRVVLPSAFYFSNGAESLPSLQVDMKDGLGWRNINFDTPFEVIYSSEGGIEVEIELKATYASEVKLSRIVKKTAMACSYPLPVNGPWLGNFVYQGTPMKYGFQAPNGAWGNAYVRYRKNPLPGEENVFRRPVIMIDGIDFGEPTESGKPIGTSDRLGDLGWPTLWNCQPDDYPFEHFPEFLNILYDEDYDLIMLDFGNGTDYIQRNAMLLVELINRINQYKAGDEGIVIVGASMGGQVARYALTYMEANNIDHCTRLFASFDSPWKGANIPLSVQYFVKYAAEEIGDDKAEDLKEDLNSPAARQLLKFHYTAAPCSTHTSNKKLWRYCNYPSGTVEYSHNLRTAFMNEVVALGDYPKQCRNIAIADGANDGLHNFSNGTQFVGYDKTWSCFLPRFPFYYWLKLRFDLYSNGRSDNLVSSLDYPGKWWERTYITNQPLIDNAPGGQRNDIKTIKKNLEEGFDTWYTWNCINKGSVSIPRTNSTFIPTTSALNLNTDDLYYDVSGFVDGNMPYLSGMTHLDALYAEEGGDAEHVEGTVDDPITSNKIEGNLPWLLAQIQNGADVLQQKQGGTLAKKWNVPLEASLVNSVDINAGGILYVNAHEPRFDEPDVMENYAPSGGLAKVWIGGLCSTTEVININSGGEMILGESGTLNKAYVYVSDGAEINVNSGGTLNVNKDSKLIIQDGGKLVINGTGQLNILDLAALVIEDGGNLVYESGAQLDLAGYGSRLTIKGKLSVSDNANFSFTGNGRLVFDQDVPWVQNAATSTWYQ